jgi:hypothetical protein
MKDNSYSDNSAKFQAFNFIRSKIPYSPVLQELLRKGNTESIYWRNLNGISDSDSNSDSDMSSVLQQMCLADQRKFLEYHSNKQGDMEWQFCC